ncbi:hypothetical protein [Nocardia sp. R7R-8]|uniref:hypothetical protein n=1 Tax=Nocardia sp. R7R-8 TaxID=3459304 RepID=UPI00403D9221
MTTLRMIGAAVSAVTVMLAGNAFAQADPTTAGPDLVPIGLVEADPADFLDGDTVYFSDWLGQANCAIHPNGDVACDLTAGYRLWGVVPITDIAIDAPFLPAHPTFGLAGQHGRPGSRWITDVPRPEGVYQGTSLSYAGVTCIGGLPRGATNCTSKGHSFTLGANVQIS